ncbi:MAG: hypothetical protein NTY68_04400 [Candidatus Micrarchaeota archaeon]|nr:hypothetical protein [Candidatus Micrarchaeota archaeon]
MKRMIALVFLFMLLSGCILDSAKTDLGKDSKGNNVTVGSSLDEMRSELGTCGNGTYKFGVNKLPCCDLINSSTGKCDHLFNLDTNNTYNKSYPGNSQESCNITIGTCTMVDLKRTKLPLTTPPNTTDMYNNTINVCPTIAKSICMENCTVGVIRDYSINEKPGFSSADIQQLRLIYGNDSDPRIANATMKEDSNMNIKRQNLLYSDSAYSAIDSQIAQDLKGDAAMDIFRFGVGSTFKDFDQASLFLPLSTESIGEVKPIGVESYPYYYWTPAQMQKCSQEYGNNAYLCSSNGKRYSTSEMCYLNCNSGLGYTIRPSDLEAINILFNSKPNGSMDQYNEIFFNQYNSSYANKTVPGNIIPFLPILSSSLLLRTSENVITTKVPSYLLDEYGPMGGSYLVKQDSINFTNSTTPNVAGNVQVNYYLNNLKNGYMSSFSKYSLTSQVTQLDGRQKSGLPFECSLDECKSGNCDKTSYLRSVCINGTNTLLDVNCGCDAGGCYNGTFSGLDFTKSQLNYNTNNCTLRDVPMTEKSAVTSYPSSKTVMPAGSDKQYLAIQLDLGVNATLVDNVSLNTPNPNPPPNAGFGYYWWSLINAGDGSDKSGPSGHGYATEFYYFYNGCTSKLDQYKIIRPGEDWYFKSGWSTPWDFTSSKPDYNADKQLFGYVFSYIPRTCCDNPNNPQYNVQFQYITLGDRLAQQLESSYSSSMLNNLPIVKTCGLDSNDSHYVCINPKVLNHGGNIMNLRAYGGSNTYSIYGCRLVQNISGLMIANGTGYSDTKVPITSNRLDATTCQYGGTPTYTYRNRGYDSGGIEHNNIPAYGTYEIQLSGPKGPCEGLSANDFCFATDSNGNCVKEAVAMVLLNSGSDGNYGSCKASATGAMPELRDYGVCENPSYVNLAVQKISSATQYFNATPSSSLGYIPATGYDFTATLIPFDQRSTYRPTYGTDEENMIQRFPSLSYLVTDPPFKVTTTDNKGKNITFAKFFNENISDNYNQPPNFWPPIDYLKNKTEEYLKGGISVMLVAEDPSLYTYCGTYSELSLAEQNSTCYEKCCTGNSGTYDTEYKLCTKQNQNNGGQIDTCWIYNTPPIKYACDISILSTKYGSYQACTAACENNLTELGKGFCNDTESPPFVAKLLNEIYNKSGGQKYVPLGNAIIVTGRAQTMKQNCTTIRLNSTSTMEYCYHYVDNSTFRSDLFQSSEELDNRNKLVKASCPTCTTAIEVMADLKENSSGQFQVITQNASEADTLQMNFKANTAQISLPDIFKEYGVLTYPGPPKDPGCGSTSGSQIKLSNCGDGYRAIGAVTKLGMETDELAAKGAGASIKHTVDTLTLTYNKAPVTPPQDITGPGYYSTNKDRFILCNTLGCSNANQSAFETFTFDPQKTITYSVQVKDPNNGWKGPLGTESCAVSHSYLGQNTACGHYWDCTCRVGGDTYHTETRTLTIKQWPDQVMLPHNVVSCPDASTGCPAPSAWQTCYTKPACLNQPSFSANGQFCTWLPAPDSECPGCNSVAGGISRKIGSMTVTCDPILYPIDWIAVNNPTVKGWFTSSPVNQAEINKLAAKISGYNTNNNKNIDGNICKRDSDMRTYYVQGAEKCNNLSDSTDMIVLNIEIDPLTQRYKDSNYEVWYTEMIDSIINYSSHETYVYGKPIVVYIRDIKAAPNFNITKFANVMGLNMERMIDSGIVAVNFEDWKKESVGSNIYAIDKGSTSSDPAYYNRLLYPIDENNRLTETFTAYSKLGEMFSKKVRLSIPMVINILNDSECKNMTQNNSGVNCIPQSACKDETQISSMKIRCYSGSKQVITYSFDQIAIQSGSDQDMQNIFNDPDKYRNIIASVNRYSNLKICPSNMTGSTYFLSFMSNAGYGLPVAWDQLQNQTCTAQGLTSAETISFLSGGSLDYICRLE